MQKLPLKAPARKITPPKSNFTSRTVDGKISFAGILKNRQSSSKPAPESAPPEEADFFNKTLFVMIEFVNIFKSLGGIENVYQKLLKKSDREITNFR
ncbi:hypothetical protein CDAR_296591 [Caerostris darwini]|uniref:Uncharacterized protein n=1 Tax=Caerostris darwini TaxID=1538125 RepID=A0AAV4QKU2_9ARAC|nr:hypothetical protein CDAR_296591 [Caerostris darwini]